MKANQVKRLRIKTLIREFKILSLSTRSLKTMRIVEMLLLKEVLRQIGTSPMPTREELSHTSQMRKMVISREKMKKSKMKSLRCLLNRST